MARHKQAFKSQAFQGNAAAPLTRHDALKRAADDLVRAGRQADAIDLYRQCTVLRPGDAVAFYNLGCCLQATGQFCDAATAFGRSLAIRPTAQAHINLAEMLRVQSDAQGAIAHCDAALAITPGSAEAHLVRGLALGAVALGTVARPGEALEALRAAVRLKPMHADARLHLGTCLALAGDLAGALVHLKKASKLRPGHVATLMALSELHQKAGRAFEAFDAIRKASEIEPRNASVYANMAGVLAATPMLDMAESSARLALDLSPNLWPAAFNLGMILMLRGRDEEAIAAYARAVEIDPLRGDALFQLVKLHERSCDWDGLDTARGLARTMTYRSGRHAPPFSVLSLAASPHDHQLSARAFAATISVHGRSPLAACRPREGASGRLRIGYMSADLRVHPVADLIAEVFELHDRAKIETFGYSIGADDGSAMRARLVAALDHFRDIRALGDEDAAQAIFADRIDILVDLTGYTNGQRARILAHRPAPVQVNFLGYPGTMGAPFVDYILADRHVAPFEHGRFYDEKIVHLPHCYQPNDRKRFGLRGLASRGSETRAMHGLPEAGFVFCCFNNTYKVSREVFDVWARLLAAVPGSVLWLLKNDDRVEGTLRREAEARGVDGARLVFAPRLDSARHAARVPLADLFLDTLLYNAHTTASEALWLGVPVVTMIGEAFPARVGASLLRALDLPDLVTETLAAYEAKALALATDPAALAAIGARLTRARDEAPLFDAPRFTLHLEAAYAGMARRLADGLPPEAFAVEDA